MNCIKLTENDEALISDLAALASEIWKEHYDPILGSEQNDYMIEKFQSAAAIKEQLRNNVTYCLVCTDEGEKAGFVAFYPRENELYLSKFYLHKSQRGKGIARQMMDFVIAEAGKINASSVTLNVNRYNDLAIAVYEKLGLKRIRSEKIDIGKGWYMDDYVYEYKL